MGVSFPIDPSDVRLVPTALLAAAAAFVLLRATAIDVPLSLVLLPRSGDGARGDEPPAATLPVPLPTPHP